MAILILILKKIIDTTFTAKKNYFIKKQKLILSHFLYFEKKIGEMYCVCCPKSSRQIFSVYFVFFIKSFNGGTPFTVYIL